MTTPPQSAVSGSPDDLKAVLAAFEERTVVVETLAGEVTSLVGEVRGLRTAVAHRPPRREIERKRRLAALAVALWSLALIFAHDQHVESCGPGARTEQVVDAFLGGETEIEVLRQSARPTTPFLCDALFPFHTHGVDGEPETSAHAAGVIFYGVLAGGALLWAVHGGGRTRREEVAEADDIADALRVANTR